MLRSDCTQNCKFPNSLWQNSTGMPTEVGFPTKKLGVTPSIFSLRLVRSTLHFNMAAPCINSTMMWWKHVYFKRSASKINVTCSAFNYKLNKSKVAFAYGK